MIIFVEGYVKYLEYNPYLIICFFTLKLDASKNRIEFSNRYSISPQNIKEAQRRYDQIKGPMFLMTRINISTPKLFCL